MSLEKKVSITLTTNEKDEEVIRGLFMRLIKKYTYGIVINNIVVFNISGDVSTIDNYYEGAGFKEEVE